MANTIEQRNLTMLTAAETLSLSRAAELDLADDETLIVKYRDEFLYIQRAAEQGLRQVDTLVENPTELSILAESWGFTCTVEDRFASRIVFRKNLGQEQVIRKLSNIRIDWSRPRPPTVDIDYYRETGNLVSLVDSTLAIPRLDRVRQQLGITSSDYTVDKTQVQI